MGADNRKQVDFQVLLIRETHHSSKKEESHHYIAYCPALQLTAYGDSSDDAEEQFEEALWLMWFEDEDPHGAQLALLETGGWLFNPEENRYYLPELTTEQIEETIKKEFPKGEFVGFFTPVAYTTPPRK